MKSVPTHRLVAGFSLVEVTLALGVAAFCLVAILGMIPVGLTSSQNATAQTGAVSILRAVAADLRDTALANASGGATPASPHYGFKVPDTTGTPIYVDEGGSVTTQPLAYYRVYVQTVYQPAATARNASRERVAISWPAQSASPAGTLESIAALDRN